MARLQRAVHGRAANFYAMYSSVLGGIVTDPAATAQARDGVIAFMTAEGWTVQQSLPSPITGGDGNKEIVALFRRG